MTEENSAAAESIPPHLFNHIPETGKERALILKTAKFVKDAGGQVEVLLKVQQAENLKFGFLFDGHDHHPFYKWILQKPGNPKLDWSVLNSSVKVPEEKTDELPSENIQQIMNVLITYIKRLGPEFEKLVRQKCTEISEFKFLFEEHRYNNFYKELLKRETQLQEANTDIKKIIPDRKKRRFHSPPPDLKTSTVPKTDSNLNRKLRIQQILKEKQKKLLPSLDQITHSKTDAMTLEAHRRAFEQDF